MVPGANLLDRRRDEPTDGALEEQRLVGAVESLELGPGLGTLVYVDRRYLEL